METVRKRTKNGQQYDHLFPKAKGVTTTIKREANVAHTVNFIPKVVKNTLYQTEKIAPLLKGKNLYDTCNKIWDFVHDHISYEKDAHGKEQVRSPRRVWADRGHGVDCDCYSTFISSILTNLGIPHTLRIAKYKHDYFQHIYPIVPDEKGNYITIDCVVYEFDYEEPYSQKQDTKMDLEYLDGINDDESLFNSFPDQDMGALGKGKFFKKVGTAVKKVVHVLNRLNPAIGMLRLGLLAAMKTNLFTIAGRIKWAYLSEAQAVAKGVIPQKYHQLRQVLSKVEKIFYDAGGKPENLKKAILSGHGNKHRDVLAGLGMMDMNSTLNEATPLPQLLGDDIYYSEMQGLDGLGEPVTAASIAAATGALSAIVILLKQVGSIFPKGNKKNDPGEVAKPTEPIDVDDSSASNDQAAPSAAANMFANATSLISNAGAAAAAIKRFPGFPSTSQNAATHENNFTANTGNDTASESSATEEGANSETEVKEGFWDKHKKWLKPTLIGVGSLTTLLIAYKVYSKNKESKIQTQPAIAGLEGTKKRKRKGKEKTSRDKKTPIALM